MPSEITELIHAAARGERASEAQLLQLIYRDLLRLARSKLAHERTYIDLNAHALVHESWMRFSRTLPVDAASRRVFFSYAGRAMQSVIVDHVRQRGAEKRGEGVVEVTLPTGYEGQAEAYPEERIDRLEAALARLERIDPSLHQIVQLRYFAGLTVDQVAELLELPAISVKRRWTRARAILAQEMGEDGPYL